MSVIIGFFGFWYDFIVGDAWEIALGVIIVLTLGAALLRTNSVDQEIVPLLVAAGIWVSSVEAYLLRRAGEFVPGIDRNGLRFMISNE